MSEGLKLHNPDTWGTQLEQLELGELKLHNRDTSRTQLLQLEPDGPKLHNRDISRIKMQLNLHYIIHLYVCFLISLEHWIWNHVVITDFHG